MARSNGNKKGEPKPVEIRCSKVAEGQFNDEVVVTLVSSAGDINMILPRAFLDQSKCAIRAIILDQSQDDYLIGLPNETFTTGSRVWFPKSAVSI